MPSPGITAIFFDGLTDERYHSKRKPGITPAKFHCGWATNLHPSCFAIIKLNMQFVAQEQDAVTQSDSRQELTALVSGCGIYRPSRALFAITGNDRVRWLNGMVTNNIRDLIVGRGVYAFVLNAQGHILGDIYVFNRGESLIAETELAQAASLLQILRRYIIMDKVEIEDLGAKIAVIGVAGPSSAAILAAAGLKVELESLSLYNLNWKGLDITVLCGDNPCFPTYEIGIPAHQAEALWNQLLDAGAVAVSNDALETFRILCGIPKFGQDIRERTLPQETGQDRALNFTKGCYIGQEIVERIRARGNVHRMFLGFEVEGLAPEPGTKIQSAGKDVGEITSIASSFLEGRRLALGYLRKEFGEGNQVLSAGQAAIKPRTLPFKDILS